MAPDPILVVEDLHAGYSGVPVLAGISLTMQRGRITCVLGRNGAGKTTLLRAVSGLIKVHGGSVRLDGERIDGLPPHKIALVGVRHVPEGKGLLRQLSVSDNLHLGMYGLTVERTEKQRRISEVCDLFEVLGRKLGDQAGSLSGGEQQMLAIGQALLSKPKVLLLDEPSLGLSPVMVQRVFEAIAQLNGDGLSVLLIEQIVEKALAVAHDAYVLRGGTVALSGTSAEVGAQEHLTAAYLGVGAALPD